MPAFYKIDKGQRLVLTTASDVFSFADALEHKDKLLKDPDFDPDYSQIINFSQITRIDITAEEINAFAQFNIFSPQSRRAIIAPGDVAYGMSRMFSVLREQYGEKGIRVFRTLDEALEWVFSKGESA
jgi:hypothetical protein